MATDKPCGMQSPSTYHLSVAPLYSEANKDTARVLYEARLRPAHCNLPADHQGPHATTTEWER